MRRLTYEQFIEKLSISNPDITAIGKYVNLHTKIECVCPVGHHWFPIAQDVIRGEGCSECGLKDCVDQRPLPFDFYLPDYNLLIEYQGAQHYMATRHMGDEEGLIYRQKHDCIKREYCKTKKINFLEIPYTKFNHISEILDEALQNIKTGDGDLCRSQNA